jgi:peptide/nickel transport system permease protein
MVSFVIIQLPPGDFASRYKQNLIEQGGLSEHEAQIMADKLRARYGLDKPLPVQYLSWVGGIVTKGSFGFSFAYKKDVGELIKERLPRTFYLAIITHIIATFFGLLIGIYSATRQYSIGDNIATFIAFIGMAVPRFFLALIIMYWLIFKMGQTHVGSFFSPEYLLAPWSFAKCFDLIKHVWPVILIAGLGGLARNMRVMRANLLDVLNSQYVTTARSKGLLERNVVNKHAVPNALHPIVMFQGMVLPYMIQGEMEAAIVLSLPTMGPMFYDSLINQDIYVSGSFLLMLSVLLVAGNLVADVMLGFLDPRVRYD